MGSVFKNWKLRVVALSGMTAVAIASGLENIEAEDPQEQRIIVVTADSSPQDEDAQVQADEKEEASIATVTGVKAPKLWLGVMLKKVEGDLARYLGDEQGILVDSVVRDSPAAKAGLQEGDILLSVGGTRLKEPQDLMKVISELEDEDARLNLTLQRKGEKIDVSVEPTARPEMEEIVVEGLENLEVDSEEEGEAAEAIKSVLRRLRVGDGDEDMSILRFGSPSVVFRGRAGGAAAKGDLEAIIVQEIDGEKTEIKVVRKDDQPAKVTVTKGEEVQEYTAEEWDEIPGDIAVIVKPMLGGKAMIGVGVGGEFQVNTPEWFDANIGKIDQEELIRKAQELAREATQKIKVEELAEKTRKIAEQTAEEARARAAEAIEQTRRASRRRAAEVSEVQQLREMVEELRRELDKLRAELKAKEGNDK